MTTSLKVELNIRKSKENVTFSLLPRRSSQQQTIRYIVDATEGFSSWEADSPATVTLSLKRGIHQLSIDVDGKLPIGVLTLPEQTSALLEELPPLVTPEAGKPARKGLIWNPETAPKNLTRVSETLFDRNPQLMYLTETFARLPKLKEIPARLFLPIPKVRIFSAVFKESGITTLDPMLFSAAVYATDFREAFRGCKDLKQVPANLFQSNTKAWLFDHAFENSGLQELPATLFQGVMKGASFARTFALCPLKRVPEGFLHAIEPTEVDGMFEVDTTIENDPLKIKAAPRFPASFIQEIRKARGIPTYSEKVSSPQDAKSE